MKFIIKITKYSLLHFLIIMLATIPITASAQDVIVTSPPQVVDTSPPLIIDSSSPQSLLVEPAIVVTETRVEPDCHTYTGCSLIVVKKPHKPKRHKVYRKPCCDVGHCYVRPVRHCW
jgi:hypothetical protein